MRDVFLRDILYPKFNTIRLDSDDLDGRPYDSTINRLGPRRLQKRYDMDRECDIGEYWIEPGERMVVQKQEQFYEAIFKWPEVFWGGSRGNAKTHALLASHIVKHLSWRARGITNQTTAMFTETKVQLRERHEPLIPQIFPSWLGWYDSEAMVYHFYPKFGGGIIMFLYIGTRKTEIERILSYNLAYITVDELTRQSEHAYKFILSCLRSSAVPSSEWCVASASNPGSSGHCVPHGDVLTPNRGWVAIQDMRVGDPVYTVLSDGSLAESAVAQVHEYDYDGPMVEVNGENLKMSCTPNHRVAKQYGIRKGKWTRAGSGDLFSLVPFEELPGQAQIMRSVKYDAPDLGDFILEYKETKQPKHAQPFRLSGDNFCSFLGWFLSEGHITSQHALVFISQQKAAQCAEIESLLDRCGFKYNRAAQGFSIFSRSWCEYLRQFGKCREKFIPQWVKNGSANNLLALLDSLMAGDGHWSNADHTSGYYYTTSKRLADDVCEVLVKLGATTRVTSRQRKDRVGLSCTVGFLWGSGFTEILTGHRKYKVETTTKRRTDITRPNFKGKVYCIGVPDTHTFLIRQNGSVWVSGNSWVNRRFVKKKDRDKSAQKGELRYFIRAIAKDNPMLPASYWEKQLSKLSGKMARAYRDGDWTVLEGQYFDMLDPEIHLIPKRRIPDEVAKYVGIDLGTNHPSACVWIAHFPKTDEHPDGRFIVYRYLEMREKWPNKVKAEIWRRMQHDKNVVYPITLSHDAFGNRQSTEGYLTMGQMFNTKNKDGPDLNCVRSEAYSGSRVVGWRMLLSLLSFEDHIEKDENGVPERKIDQPPHLYFMDTPEVRVLYEEIEAMQHKDGDSEDAERSMGNEYEVGDGDDGPDALRYALQGVELDALYQPSGAESDVEPYDPMRDMPEEEEYAGHGGGYAMFVL